MAYIAVVFYDRLMLVGVSINNDNLETVSSITYNGVNLTYVGSETQNDEARVELWMLVAPPTGTHNVVITFSAWSSSVTDGGDLAVTTAAALEGSWGMQAVIDDNPAIYVTDQTPQDKTSYNLSFRYDPNSIGRGSRDLFTLLAGYLDDGNLTFEVQQYSASGSRKLRAVLYLDSGSSGTFTTPTFLSRKAGREGSASGGAAIEFKYDRQMEQGAPKG